MAGVYRCCRFTARNFAAASRFCANPAMFVHLGVALALLGANPAGFFASFNRGDDDAFIGAGAARGDVACRGANVRAIKIEPDALTQFEHHLLAKTGVRADGAGLRAVKTFLNATDERVVGRDPHLRMGADHFMSVHNVFLSLFR